ncbi:MULTISPECIES: HPr family phosphocarrier protein [unclassified Mesorhizobium]|uniref:HPr family phosphocarrier protein n=1 Tax=unclassified Mesorhizobium TaxID=325217 RepID=UPI000FE57092|nr:MULTISPECIES: HPr family phosphocarrier protein [unclassified Mesorhizobium]RWI29072.1 MAG: HPr family phosphocarrier protein [Mesorhizobium sp.]RWK52808.1 MAG: HPr family phosphocarrier protein [Mesorhizobium sp.]RWK97716.1 MAG: HPr family phosphocarrier protein [Mesorhizobium sp.]RWK98095.1 MAG: HPr family phosphocarrier protein [Mesorhizobium sp.]TIP56360.1 MAG: HPr family phosphocarrier protein [Mesorhizobium sp.]
MSASAEATVLITHEVGLHARPSVKFTKLAKTFSAEVEVALAANGPWFDAKSIVKVMAAKAPKGTVLHIRAKGDSAGEAVGALVELVRRDFDEGVDHARTA